MSNIKIAHTYAKLYADMATANGNWISDNLPTLSKTERKAILKIYKQYWSEVKYEPSGLCVCSKPRVKREQPNLTPEELESIARQIARATISEALRQQYEEIKSDEEDEEVEQYKQECGNSCGCVLTINTPVMCWNNGERELTLCNECYWDAGYWKDDQNEDNQDEIEEFKSQ